VSEKKQEKIFIRIIELPKVKMARSGPGNLNVFDQWWSSIKINPQNNLCPRDFLWFKPQLNDLDWLFVLPENLEDTAGFDVFDFPGGLFAVATTIDSEENIGETSALIHQWISQSEFFDEDPNLDPQNPRYDMGRITTPVNAKATIGYHQMELWVPIVYKNK
jgi:hypothetical protein